MLISKASEPTPPGVTITRSLTTDQILGLNKQEKSLPTETANMGNKRDSLCMRYLDSGRTKIVSTPLT